MRFVSLLGYWLWSSLSVLFCFVRVFRFRVVRSASTTQGQQHVSPIEQSLSLSRSLFLRSKTRTSDNRRRRRRLRCPTRRDQNRQLKQQQQQPYSPPPANGTIQNTTDATHDQIDQIYTRLSDRPTDRTTRHSRLAGLSGY